MSNCTYENAVQRFVCIFFCLCVHVAWDRGSYSFCFSNMTIRAEMCADPQKLLMLDLMSITAWPNLWTEGRKH